MAIIKFSNGISVNFNGNPTPQDIEEVAKRLSVGNSDNKLSANQKSAQEFNPTLASQAETGLVGGLKETGKMLANIPKSAAQFGYGLIKGLATAPVEAVKTAKNIGEGLAGAEKEMGGMGNVLKGTAKELLPTAYHLLTPKFIQDLIKGDTEEAQRSIVNDPVGQIAPLILAAKATADAMGKTAQFDAAMKMVAKPIEMPIQYARTATATAVRNSLDGLADKLDQSTLRLSPTQKKAYGNTVDKIVKLIDEEKITGNPEERYQKINKLYEKTEDTFQGFLEKEANGVSIDRAKLVQELKSAKKSSMADKVDQSEISAKFNKVINLVESKYSDKIPVSNLNKLKRSAYKQTYNQGGSMPGTKVTDPTYHSIGDILRSNIEESTSNLSIKGMSVPEFNQRYGVIINARNLLNAAQYKPQIGIIGKIVASSVGGSVGYSIGGPIGSGMGILMGQGGAEIVAGTQAKGLVSGALRAKTPTSIKNIGGKATKIIGKPGQVAPYGALKPK